MKTVRLKLNGYDSEDVAGLIDTIELNDQLFELETLEVEATNDTSVEADEILERVDDHLKQRVESLESECERWESIVFDKQDQIDQLETKLLECQRSNVKHVQTIEDLRGALTTQADRIASLEKSENLFIEDLQRAQLTNQELRRQVDAVRNELKIVNHRNATQAASIDQLNRINADLSRKLENAAIALDTD